MERYALSFLPEPCPVFRMIPPPEAEPMPYGETTMWVASATKQFIFLFNFLNF